MENSACGIDLEDGDAKLLDRHHLSLTGRLKGILCQQTDSL